MKADKKLRNSARGEECTLRIPGVCCGDPETTVLAHVGRRRGMGMKCHDTFAVYACHACHDAIDGRNRNYSRRELCQWILDALEETQERMREKGLMK